MTETIYNFVSSQLTEDGDTVEPHFGTWCDECGYGALAGHRFPCRGRDEDDTVCEITLCLDCYLQACS